jgi:hypothetical protein
VTELTDEQAIRLLVAIHFSGRPLSERLAGALHRLLFGPWRRAGRGGHPRATAGRP